MSAQETKKGSLLVNSWSRRGRRRWRNKWRRDFPLFLQFTALLWLIMPPPRLLRGLQGWGGWSLRLLCCSNSTSLLTILLASFSAYDLLFHLGKRVHPLLDSGDDCLLAPLEHLTTLDRAQHLAVMMLTKPPLSKKFKPLTTWLLLTGLLTTWLLLTGLSTAKRELGAPSTRNLLLRNQLPVMLLCCLPLITCNIRLEAVNWLIELPVKHIGLKKYFGITEQNVVWWPNYPDLRKFCLLSWLSPLVSSITAVNFPWSGWNGHHSGSNQI